MGMSGWAGWQASQGSEFRINRIMLKRQHFKPNPFIFSFLAALILSQSCTMGRITCGAHGEGRFYGRRIMDSIGGPRALEPIKYLRFDFIVEDEGDEILRRKHWWDRKNNLYRIEGKFRDESFAARFNLKSLKGEVSRSFDELGEEVFEPDDELIEYAYQCHINDSYWLLSATKLCDQGAILKFEGVRDSALGSYPTLHLSFQEGAGLTPGDHYWFHMDPDTSRPVGWSFILQDQSGTMNTFRWTQWRNIRQLELPVKFEHLNSTRIIKIENLYAPDEIL
jgi:hypothetical protein